MNEIKFYKTERGDSPAEMFLEEILSNGSETDYAKATLYIKYLKEYGLSMKQVVSPRSIQNLKKTGGLWELRPVPNRIFFFCLDNNTFVLLHGFRKKSNETPPGQIEQAQREMQDYKRRNGHG